MKTMEVMGINVSTIETDSKSEGVWSFACGAEHVDDAQTAARFTNYFTHASEFI